MNQQLNILVELQTVQNRVRELQHQTEEIPEQISDLESKIEEARSRLGEASQSLADNQRDRRLQEQALEDLREKLRKFKSQLMEVKTNKEYQAVLHEIENTEKEISDCEDRILEQMLASDEHSEQIRKLETESRSVQGDLEKEISSLRVAGREAARELEKLASQQEVLIDALDPEIRSQYERIARARPGTAVAAVADHSCQQCHVRLRPQLVNEIKLNTRIITCENCNRILHFPGA